MQKGTIFVFTLPKVVYHTDLKTDPVYETDMKTLRSFMKDDEIEYTETVEDAVSKRKYLLNSLFDLEDNPKDTLTEDDNLTDARPRKTFSNKICND